MIEEKTAFVVGASRGLGLGLVQELLRRDWTVVATERSRSDVLHRLQEQSFGRVLIETLDVADDDSIRSLAERLEVETLDLLFLNAGVMGPPDLMAAAPDDIDRVMQANAFGPARLARRLLDRVRPGTGVVAFMSTGMASIADNTSGGYEVYRASKAAQNMLARSLWVGQAKARGVTVLSVNPGWVKTDMGGPGGTIDVDTSVRGIADQVEQRAGSGEHAFVGWNGRILPW